MRLIRTSSKTALIALVAIALAALAPSTLTAFVPGAPGTAHAGSYLARYCNAGIAGAGGVPSWGSLDFAGAPSAAGNLCPSGLVLFRSGGGAGPMSWSSPAVDQSTLQFVKADFMSYSSSQGGSSNVAEFCSSWSTNICSIAGGTAFAVLGAGGANTITTPHTVVANNGQYFRIELTGGAGTNASIDIWNIDLTVNDNTLPAVVQSGGSIDTAGWNAGSKTIGYSLTDTGSGVERGAFGIDGVADVAGDPNPACARVVGGYSAVHPCSSSFSAVHTLDTTTVTDGTHTMHGAAVDASGNRSASAVTTVKVDNTPPSEPSYLDVIGANDEGWQSVNGFDVDWENGDEVVETAMQAGIAKSCYDIGPAEGQVTDPAPACVTDALDELSSLEVPEDGEWDVDVWTVDRAGNESGKAHAVLRLDTTVPGKPTGQANGWIGLQDLLIGKDQLWARPLNHASVNSEICGYGFSVTPNATDEAPATINVIGDITGAAIPAGTPEGISWAHFRPVSCAGLVGPSEHVEVKVDLTKPRASVTGIPASGWTNSPGVVNVIGTDSMPGSGMDPAPPLHDVSRGASIRFDFDGATAEEDRGGTGLFDASSLPEGPHSLTVRTFDVARNSEEQAFGYGVDKTAPGGAFAGVDARDPTVFRVPVTDALSGVVGGTVQYARIGPDGDEGEFKSLATGLDHGELVATFPDTALPRGSYALRAIVDDAAANTGLVTKDLHGKRMVIATPLRRAASIEFAGTAVAKSCKRARARTKAGKRRADRRLKRCRRARAKGRLTDAVMRVRFGRAATLRGRLADEAGRPIAGQQIELWEQRAGSELRLVGAATTNGAGGFSYKAPGGPSRRVNAVWPGTKTQQDASASARLAVPAKVSLRVTPRVVRGARRFTFRGKVFTQDGISPLGKLVQLQFYNPTRRRWQAGPALVRAGKDGRFRYSYRILRADSANQTIAFRAFVPAETGWAYDAGTSPRRMIVHTR